MSCDCLEVPQEACLLAGKSLTVEIDLDSYCRKPWHPNEYVAEGEAIRPTRANGFAAVVQTGGAGTTGGREPVWPNTAGATVKDGSATWVMTNPGADSLIGINAATGPTGAVSPDSGLAVGGLSIVEGRKLVVTYTATTAGQYVATFLFTVAGKERWARQAVRVE